MWLACILPTGDAGRRYRVACRIPSVFRKGYRFLENPLSSPPSETHLIRQQVQVAIGQIEFARAYVLELLAATPQDRWTEIPAGATSCIAWQAGHLAVSQYGLLMFRVRGRRPEDLELIPGPFRKKYGRGSKPTPEPPDGDVAADLLQRMGRVHQLAIEELRQVDVQSLLEPVDMPYAVYPNKLGAILFCPLHEQLHAGQIGLLRRQLGLESIR
jgi:hypothetical protein